MSVVSVLDTFTNGKDKYILTIVSEENPPSLALAKRDYATYFNHRVLQIREYQLPALLEYLQEHYQPIENLFKEANKSSAAFWKAMQEQVDHYNEKNKTLLPLRTVIILPQDLLSRILSFIANPQVTSKVCKAFYRATYKSHSFYSKICSQLKEQATGYLKTVLDQTINNQPLHEQNSLQIIQDIYKRLVSQIKQLDSKQTILTETQYLGRISPARLKKLAKWIEDKNLINFARSLKKVEKGSLADRADEIRKFLREEPSIGSMENLNLANHSMIYLPPEIKYFKNIKTLNLSQNKLTQLGCFPQEIKELKLLEEVDISYTPIQETPWQLLEAEIEVKKGFISPDEVIKVGRMINPTRAFSQLKKI